MCTEPACCPQLFVVMLFLLAGSQELILCTLLCEMLCAATGTWLATLQAETAGQLLVDCGTKACLLIFVTFHAVMHTSNMKQFSVVVCITGFALAT